MSDKPAPTTRLPCLDGLRALAVAAVLLSHSMSCHGWPKGQLMDQLPRIFAGVFGVQVFFTISGFIITLLLWKERRAVGSISLKNFWVRRAIRILPPAGAYLLFVGWLGMQGHADVPYETQWGSLGFYRNMMPADPWFGDRQGFTGHYWSLSVEEQFYLVWPLLVAWLSSAQLKSLAWTGVAVSLVLRCCVPWLPEKSGYWLPMNLEGFMLGAMVALDQQSGVHGLWRRAWRWRWALLGAALFFTRASASAHGAWFYAVQPLPAVAAAAVWIAGLINGESPKGTRWLNSSPMVAFGLISYSVYLWQQVWLAPPFQWATGMAPWIGRLPQSIVMSLLCGLASYLLIERPCQRFRLWLYRPRADQPSA